MHVSDQIVCTMLAFPPAFLYTIQPIFQRNMTNSNNGRQNNLEIGKYFDSLCNVVFNMPRFSFIVTSQALQIADL